ncbi:MAG TPA: cation diffusion facilitator family transporter [Flavisolibacter sp.]|jgi:cation diffusion facilitator family transporter|nr:cation diffusion facilitator family transporter [Flavisolibacter sp.]
MADSLHPTIKGIRSTILGIFISLGLAIVKGVTGILGNSYALIADAIESTADVFTSGILLIGLKTSLKPADKEHPYGHGKAESLAALVISLGLLCAAGIIIKESIDNIITPHKNPAAYTLIVLVLVIVVKELLSRYVGKVGAETNSHGVKADAFHHRSDAITSAAAFIGISIALIGGKGYHNADDYAALIASAIILINAYLIAKPAINELMDASADEEMVQGIRNLACSVDGVIEIEKTYIRKTGSSFLVDIHVVVMGTLSVADGHKIAHDVKDTIIETEPRVKDVLVHIEPDAF